MLTLLYSRTLTSLSHSHSPTTLDLLLLTHFVANSRSLRSNDHNWVPICMPDFNAKGFLQVNNQLYMYRVMCVVLLF